MSRISVGSYRVVISFIGYATKSIENVQITKADNIDLGIIKLSNISQNLSELTVTGKKALVEDRVDRLVYKAEDDLAAKGGDASDVLRKVPMLSVDPNGQLSLQGSTNVRVLINNKPSAILAGNIADALRQIPADQIKSVEVITSPSARYDAEGTGGIINIILKKNNLQGLHLDLDGAAGNRASMLALNGGFQKGKVGIGLTGSGRASYNPSESNLNQTTYPVQSSTPVKTSQHSTGFDKGLLAQYALSADYQINPRESFSGGIRLGVRNINRDQHLNTSLIESEQSLPGSLRDVLSKNLSNTIDVNIDYLHIYPDGSQGSGREFSLSAQYGQTRLTNNFDASNFESSATPTSIVRNLNNNTNHEFIFQADYLLPIRENQQLEFGLKNTFRQVRSRYRYLTARPGSDLVNDASQPEGILDYDQTIPAAYLSYALTMQNKISLKMGLRYEYTAIQASAGIQRPLVIPSYGKLIPSINLSKKIDELTTIKLAFNRRIERPGIQDLNPNFNAANPYNIQIGNPYLKPEIADRFEFGYSTQIRKTYLNVSLYARFNKDDIQWLSQRSDTLAGAVISRRQNIGKDFGYGTTIFASMDLTSRLSLSTNLDFTYRYAQSSILDLSGQSTLKQTTGLRWAGRLDGQFKFNKGWTAQANFGYRGKSINLLGYDIGFAQYSLGLRKAFKNKRGSLGLAAENFLTNGMRFESVLISPQLEQRYRQYIYNSSVRLNFSYKIGSLNRAKAKKGRSAAADQD